MNKIKIIKKELVIAITLISCLLCACVSKEKNNDVTNEHIVTQNVTIEKETTTEKVILSNECDKVLASGYDKDDNFYELVATEDENYDGTIIKIGVIKNNEWSIELTTESAFIGKEGLLRRYDGSSNVTGSIYDERYAVFYYIGNGCFFYDNIILNGNTNKYYEGDARPIIQCGGPVTTMANDNVSVICANDGKILLEGLDDDFYLLDTNTMKRKKIKLTITDFDMLIYPYSEGLIACIKKDSNSEVNGFYNIDGEKIIDLSQYDLRGRIYKYNGIGGSSSILQSMVFEYGECSFIMANKAGTEYEITINKKGQVIDSIEQ